MEKVLLTYLRINEPSTPAGPLPPIPPPKMTASAKPNTLATIQSLRESLCSEATPLPVRFRALFSLKHVAQQHEAASAEARAAIDAIAAGFASPSALLKHELAYCLGQTGNDAAIGHLTSVLEDLGQDPMCRHEAAEALGALGRADSLDVLRRFRDREGEEVVVKETCEIAIDRIEWENSEAKKKEKLRKRCVLAASFSFLHLFCGRFFALANFTQRLRLGRPRPSHASGSEPHSRGAGQDPDGHVASALPSIPGHVCPSRLGFAARPSHRRSCH